MESKVCRRCNRVKKIESFYKDAKFKDGYKSWCKICSNDAAKRSQEKTKDKPGLSRLILSSTSLDDYCKMWDFLSKIGYDVHGNIHEQFCEKYNLPVKKRRSKKSFNRYTISDCEKKDPIN